MLEAPLPATATQWAHQVRKGTLSAEKALAALFDRIERLEPKVDAFLTLEKDASLERAATIDGQVRAGEEPGKLCGVPIAIKDNMCARGYVTTCGSRILEGFRSPYDATVVERLRKQGAILIGTTNMDEFAMGSSTENSAYKSTRNPWDLKRAPGGSSGGSAAAVAAGMVPIALGSDTGGSIRQPASLCGIVGMKPTYGRVSRWGLIAFASSLDQIGPLTTTVEDAALALAILAGEDGRDSTCLPQGPPSLESLLDQPSLEGCRIGRAKQYDSEDIESDVRQAIAAAFEQLVARGATIVDIDLPHTEYAIPTYYLVATSEASSNLSRFDGVRYGPRATADDLEGMYEGTRTDGFGDEVKRRIMMGTYSLSAGYYDAFYLKALKVRRAIRDDFERAFQDVDAIVGPVSPTAAFPLGEKSLDPLLMYLCDTLTAPASLAGIPALSVPYDHTQGGLPIGVQVLGPALGDAKVLQIGRALEHGAPCAGKRPALGEAG